MRLENGKHADNNNLLGILKKYLIIIILLCSVGMMIYSGIKIFNWNKENTKNNSIQNELASAITIDETKDVVEEDKYKIDFEKLKQINDDTIGWIKVEGTDIEYSVVKTKNNDFYLNHSFDKTFNSAGWIFADYKNKIDGTDKNIVIYGHNRRDGSMFSSLKNILEKSWHTNANNKYITFINEEESTLYKVFSVYQIKEEEYYIKTDFSEGEFEDFINNLRERSIYDFNVNVTENDSILTLSTCANDNRYRVVLHAKKI